MRFTLLPTYSTDQYQNYEIKFKSSYLSPWKYQNNPKIRYFDKFANQFNDTNSKFLNFWSKLNYVRHLVIFLKSNFLLIIRIQIFKFYFIFLISSFKLMLFSYWNSYSYFVCKAKIDFVYIYKTVQGGYCQTWSRFFVYRKIRKKK